MEQAQIAQDAAPGSPERAEAERRARAYEASSQHFMTDRFASGHQFDKAELMRTNTSDDHTVPGAETVDEMEANVRASVVHDEMNRHGVDVEARNQQARWHAYGDGQWAAAENAENRYHTAHGVVASYSDVDAILQGETTYDLNASDADITNTAHQHVPDWNPAENARAQQRARDVSAREMVDAQSERLDVVPQALQRRAHNACDTATDWAGERVEAVEETGGRVLDRGQRVVNGTVEHVERDARRARRAIDSTIDATTQTVGRTVHDVHDAAVDTYDHTTQTVGRTVDNVHDAAVDTYDQTTQTIGRTVDNVHDAGSEAVDNAAMGARRAGRALQQRGSQMRRQAAALYEGLFD